MWFIECRELSINKRPWFFLIRLGIYGYLSPYLNQSFVSGNRPDWTLISPTMSKWPVFLYKYVINALDSLKICLSIVQRMLLAMLLTLPDCKSVGILLYSGPVRSIIYADLYRSIKIKFTVLIPMLINKDLCRSMRIYEGSILINKEELIPHRSA